MPWVSVCLADFITPAILANLSPRETRESTPLPVLPDSSQPLMPPIGSGFETAWLGDCPQPMMRRAPGQMSLNCRISRPCEGSWVIVHQGPRQSWKQYDGRKERSPRTGRIVGISACLQSVWPPPDNGCPKGQPEMVTPCPTGLLFSLGNLYLRPPGPCT